MKAEHKKLQKSAITFLVIIAAISMLLGVLFSPIMFTISEMTFTSSGLSDRPKS